MLALMLDINFEIVSGAQKYDESWAKKIASGELTLDQVREAAKTQLGVVHEFSVTLRADKSHLGPVGAAAPE